MTLIPNEYQKGLNKAFEMNNQTILCLIKEFEDRAEEFVSTKEIYKAEDPNYSYWEGKQSEATFIADKLKEMLNVKE